LWQKFQYLRPVHFVPGPAASEKVGKNYIVAQTMEIFEQYFYGDFLGFGMNEVPMLAGGR